jgi:hypothetical protein
MIKHAHLSDLKPSINMKKKLTLLLGVAALLSQPLMSQSVSKGVFLGFNWGLLDMSTTAPAMTNVEKAFFAGADYNGPNRDLHSSLNNNYFTIDFGGGMGTASFRLNRNDEGDGGWMRHYDEGTNAIVSVGDFVRIELTDLSLMPGATLTLNYVAFNSLDNDSDFTAVLPNGSMASGIEYATLDTPWEAGQTLRLEGAPSLLGDYNLAGWQMTAAVPEPGTTALLIGLAGMAIVLIRRRLKN